MTIVNATYINHNRRTCITYAVTGDEEQKTVHAVYMESPELRIGQEEYSKFHRHWTEIIGCDPKDAAMKYLKGQIPYPPEVKSILEKIMQEQTQEVAAQNPVEKAVAKKAAAAKKTTQDPKKPSKVKVTSSDEAPKGKKATADEKKAADFFAKQEKAAAKKAAPKGKKEAAVPAEKKGRTPKVDISGKFIHFLKNTGEKKFHEGSVRSLCFSLIKDGMKVSDYLKATAKKGVEEPMAIDCLKKLSDPNQKVPAVALKDK